MEYGGNDYYSFVLNYFVDHAVGKTLRITTERSCADVAAMKQRVHGELIEYIEQLVDEPVTQTFTAAVIPGSNLVDVLFRFRP